MPAVEAAVTKMPNLPSVSHGCRHGVTPHLSGGQVVVVLPQPVGPVTVVGREVAARQEGNDHPDISQISYMSLVPYLLFLLWYIHFLLPHLLTPCSWSKSV